MWKCKFCNYTTNKKWNVQVHEKRKHSTKNNELENNQINNEGIKIEDVPILGIRKPAHMGTIGNYMTSLIRNQSTRNDPIERVQRVQLKKMGELLLKKEFPSLRMKRKQKRKIIQDCCSSLSKIIKELKKIEPPRTRLSDWLSD